MKVYIVKGVDAHNSQNLKAFAYKPDAIEWMDNYDGDEDFSFLCVETLNVQESTNDTE